MSDPGRRGATPQVRQRVFSPALYFVSVFRSAVRGRCCCCILIELVRLHLFWPDRWWRHAQRHVLRS